jgi:hypothetical protein
MDNELKEMLIQVMEGQEALRLGQEALKLGQEESNKRLTKLEIGLESVDKRLKELAEVQKVNDAENQRYYKEIVEILSGRINLR